MNTETLTQKQLNALELTVRELLTIMSKSNLQHEALAEALRQFEAELGEARRKRFDSIYPEFSGY